MNDRCFVIGNGISLIETPLNRIAGKPSVACNRIAGMFRHTEWRPTHFVMATVHAVLPAWLYDIAETIFTTSAKCFIWDRFEKLIPPRNNIVHVRCTQTGERSEPKDKWWSDEPEKWVTHFGGSGTAMMQVAASLGYSEIVLLGMDANWKVGTDEFDPNHFRPDYGKGTGYGRQGKVDYWNRINMEAHRWIRRMTDERGIAVYNATPNTGIDAYPQVGLDYLK